MDIYGKAVDVEGLESDWTELDYDPDLTLYREQVIVEEPDTPSILWLFFFMGLFLVIIVAMLRNQGGNRVMKHSAYMTPQ